MLWKYWSTTTTLCPAAGRTTTTNTTFIYTRPQSYHSYVHSSRGAIINLMRALANQQRLALRIGSTLIELCHTRHTYIHLSMSVYKACMATGYWVLGTLQVLTLVGSGICVMLSRPQVCWCRSLEVAHMENICTYICICMCMSMWVVALWVTRWLLLDEDGAALLIIRRSRCHCLRCNLIDRRRT